MTKKKQQQSKEKYPAMFPIYMDRDLYQFLTEVHESCIPGTRTKVSVAREALHLGLHIMKNNQIKLEELDESKK